MSAPIGPGDVVECVRNRLPTTLPPRGLVVGRFYRVSEVGVTPPDDTSPNVAWVRLVEVPCSERRWGFRAEWFRPVQRWRPEDIEQLIQDLKHSAPERELETT